jgi:ribonuclease R
MGSGAREFHEVFPPHVITTSEGLPDDVTEDDKEGRKDLTGLEAFTIDPVDAKDFDDAISIIKEGENSVVWVHIADVSHYVKPNDLIDGEARFRGTSVYLPTRVIPMLPKKLSENLCSLKEGVPRLALSTKIVFSPEMELLEWEHVPSIIEVNANLNYEQVNGWIDEGKEPFLSLHKLAVHLEKKGGRLHLNTPERRIRFRDGKSIDIQIKRATRSTKLIEELMVLTNECASRFLEEKGIPLPFRVHPLPDRSAAEKFNAACEALGLEVDIEADWGGEGEDKEVGEEDAMLMALRSGGKMDLSDLRSMEGSSSKEESALMKPTTEIMDSAVASYNEVLGEIEELEEENIRDMLNLRLLRTMSQAFYSVENLAHFGLRSMSYCHFTSPIRRYPDILVHRAIKAELSEEKKGPDVSWSIPEEDEIEGNMDHINDMTESAEDWERDMVDVALATRARMTQEFLNGTHSAMVTSLTPASCFVLLDDDVTEGRLSIRHMSKYPLTVDENESRILVERTDEVLIDPRFKDARKNEDEDIVFLKLGDRVKCRIRRVRIAEGRVELSMI